MRKRSAPAVLSRASGGRCACGDSPSLKTGELTCKPRTAWRGAAGGTDTSITANYSRKSVTVYNPNSSAVVCVWQEYV